ELWREHLPGPSLLANWKDTALSGPTALVQAQEQRSPEQARMAALEQHVGRQSVELQSLNKAYRLLPGTAGRTGRSSGGCPSSTPANWPASCSTPRAGHCTVPGQRPRPTKPTCGRRCCAWSPTLKYITNQRELPAPASRRLQGCCTSVTADFPAVPGYRVELGGDYCNLSLAPAPGGRRGRRRGVVWQGVRPAPRFRPRGAGR